MPVTTVSVVVYTTTCPVSQLPGYTSVITTIKPTTAAAATTTAAMTSAVTTVTTAAATTTSRPAQYTGAANAVQVGSGAMMAAVGLAAILL